MSLLAKWLSGTDSFCLVPLSIKRVPENLLIRRLRTPTVHKGLLSSPQLSLNQDSCPIYLYFLPATLTLFLFFARSLNSLNVPFASTPRLSILHHPGSNPVPRWQAHYLWTSLERDEGRPETGCRQH